MQNDTGLEKIHVDTVSYAGVAMDQVRDHIRLGFSDGGSRISGRSLRVQLDVATTRTGREMLFMRYVTMLLSLLIPTGVLWRLQLRIRHQVRVRLLFCDGRKVLGCVCRLGIVKG